MSKTTTNAITIIKESLTASLNGTATFPEHVKAVTSVNVTRYEVNLIEKSATYYFADGKVHIETLPTITTNTPIKNFRQPEVKAAITDIQSKLIDYPTFLTRILSAGTKSYVVDIDKGQVVYLGQDDQHVELFPRINR